MMFTDDLADRVLPGPRVSRLAHTWADAPGGVPAESEEELLRRFFPPGTVLELYSPVFAPEAAAMLEELLAQHRASGIPFHPGHQITTDEAGFRAIEQVMAEIAKTRTEHGTPGANDVLS